MGFPEITLLQFTGKERDQEIGLDYSDARWLSPGSVHKSRMRRSRINIRKISKLNLYSYVCNNPPAYIDPTEKKLTLGSNAKRYKKIMQGDQLGIKDVDFLFP